MDDWSPRQATALGLLVVTTAVISAAVCAVVAAGVVTAAARLWAHNTEGRR